MPELVVLPLALPGVMLTLPMIDTIGGPWWLSLAVCAAVGALINAAVINGVAAMARRSNRSAIAVPGRAVNGSL
ncbi:hypothetical protein AB0J80_34310 [Actinoplanes sp. NPDC049548]|uniref:hypothetical protein n=1 Tax=Actinoplanes sp. NPDC049548 TaxID=3155152 RepID=UPI00342F3BC3